MARNLGNASQIRGVEPRPVEPVGGILCHGASYTLINSLPSGLVLQNRPHRMSMTVLQRLFPHKYAAVIVTSTGLPSRDLNISCWKLLQQ